jgi:chromosome segregation ATPase
MTEEISYYDEDLTELITEIERGIDGLRKLSPVAKNQRINELQGRMQRAKQVLQAFKVEMRELPREAAATYDAKAKAHHATLQKLHGDLQWAKTEGSAAAGGAKNVDEMTSGEIIQEGAGIQDKSKAAVDRMKRQIEESKQVGAETASKLKGQTEQLKNIDQDIMKVKSNLKPLTLTVTLSLTPNPPNL